MSTWGLWGALRSFHAIVLGMSTGRSFPFCSRPPPGCAPLCSSFRLSRGYRGSDLSCGVSQGGQHPQVTNCHLGTLRRIHQEQPCPQHPSSDHVHHGRPGALWQVSEAPAAQLRPSSASPLTSDQLPVAVIPGYVGGKDFFPFYFSWWFSEESLLCSNSHYSPCPLP